MAAAGAATLLAWLVAAEVVRAVDTDLTIDTTAISFGEVTVGSTGGPTSVTLTNAGGDPFGPINMFGGAPPTAEFGASQNCQGVTLPAGGTCTVGYTFSPGSAGTFNDVSSFTVSETANQTDGEDFSVSLTGNGVDPTPATPTPAPTDTPAPTPEPTLIPTIPPPAASTGPVSPAASETPTASGADSSDDEPLGAFGGILLGAALVVAAVSLFLLIRLRRHQERYG